MAQEQKHETEEEAVESFSNFVNEILSSKHQGWMGIVVGIMEDGSLKLSRTTCNFNRGKLSESIAAIVENLAPEIAAAPTSTEEVPLHSFMDLQRKVQERMKAQDAQKEAPRVLPMRDDDPSHDTNEEHS